jgi:hypothetical protein
MVVCGEWRRGEGARGLTSPGPGAGSETCELYARDAGKDNASSFPFLDDQVPPSTAYGHTIRYF